MDIFRTCGGLMAISGTFGGMMSKASVAAMVIFNGDTRCAFLQYEALIARLDDR